MQTIKKHLLDRLLAFMAVALMTTGAAWAQVSVDVSDIIGRPGATVTVPVTLSNVSNLTSFQFTVNTGADLSLSGYSTAGTISDGFTLSVNPSGGAGTSVAFGGFSGTPATSDGVLINLEFLLGGSTGTGNVTLDNSEYNGVAPSGGGSSPGAYVIADTFLEPADVTFRTADAASITVNAVDALTNLVAFTVDVTVGSEFDGSSVTASAGALTASGWSFSVNEISSGVYRVGGFGTSTSGTGSLFLLNGTAATLGAATVSLSNFDFTDASLATIPVAGDTGVFTVVANSAPTADAQSVTTAEDTATAITLTGTDANSDPLTFTVATNPTSGTLSGTAPNLTYTPNADFNGSDSFTFTVNDGLAPESAAATVDITVTAVNDAPTATAGTATTAEDTAVDITMGGADIDGDALTYTSTDPANGSVSIVGAVATYTPDANYNGTDTFDYTVSDGTLTATATVTVTVTAVNDAPAAAPVTATTAEDTAVDATLLGSDVDGDTVTYTAVDGTNGSVTVLGAVATYTPNADFNGTDTFDYTVSDGTLSTTGTVTVTVTPVNDAPTAAAVVATTAEDTPADITLGGADVDGDALTYTSTDPANGAVTIAGAVATYTPAANYNGSDSFDYTVSDGTLTATATVTVTVTAANDAPVADDLAASVDEDGSVDVTLTGTDVEGDAITFAIDTAPTSGSVTLAGAVATYTPNADFNGTDTFTYTGSDATGTGAAATVTVTVNPVNDAPVFTAELGDISTLEDAMVLFTYAATDVDGDALTYAVVSPSGATIDASGNFAWNPAGSVGANTVQVSVSDGTETVNSAEATVTVLRVDDLILGFAGVHEVPPVMTPGGGGGWIRIVESAGTIEVNFTVDQLSSAYTASHIHIAPVGQNGGVAVALTGTASADGRSVTVAQTIDLGANPPSNGMSAAELIAALRAGQGYVNVHTEGNGPGEVRSQILAAGNGAPTAVEVRGPSEVTITGNGDDRLYSVSWLPATDPDGDPINYIYELALDAAFQDVVFGENFGTGNGFRVTVEEAAYLYDELTGAAPGMVDLGGTITVYQRIITSDGVLWTSGPGTTLMMTRGTVTANETEDELPLEFALQGNYPNPFNPSTTIQFDLPEPADVSITVTDMLGRQVLSVPVEAMEAGKARSVSISAAGLSSGLYLYRVVARSAQNTWAQVGTMTLIK